MVNKETEEALGEGPIGLSSAPVRDQTLRIKLANSLLSEVKRVSQNKGISMNYLVTQAIQEKIARFMGIRQRSNEDRKSDLHLVSDNLKPRENMMQRESEAEISERLDS